MLSPRAESVLRQACRAYRAALFVLPRGIRRPYGLQLQRTFRDVSAAAFGRSQWSGMLFAWLRMFGELTLVAPREHLLRLTSRSPHQKMLNQAGPRAAVENTMYNILNDFRVALRQLRQNPAFSAAAILTLALGIGANTAIFTVLHSVLLRPLAYDTPDQLAAVWMEFRNQQGGRFEIAASEPEFLDFRDETQSFASIAGYWLSEVNLGGIDAPERVGAASVSANFLGVLGVVPMLGRTFTESEDLPGADRVALLGNGLWRRSFGADTNIIGSSVLVDGRSTIIIGVLPPSFRFPSYDAQILRQNFLNPLEPSGRSSHYLSMVGRLKEGVSLETARAETATLMSAWTSAFPDRHGPSIDRHPLVMTNLHDRLVGNTRPVLLVLSGAVAMVLLIACANVAGLLLARAEARQREMAIRTAIGAARSRLVTQLLNESVVLALIGGVAGVGIAFFGVRMIIAMGPADLPRLSDISVNGVTLAFAIGVSVVAGIAFGIAPALTAGRSGAAAAFRDGATTSSSQRLILRRVLIVTEMAVALVLAIGAGLLIKNLAALNKIDPGFETDGVVTMEFALNAASYPNNSDVAAFHRDLTSRLQAIPSITSTGAIRALPLIRDAGMETINLIGRTRSESEPNWNTEYQVTGVGYFDALSIPILMGRKFTERDSETSRPVAMINKSMADRFWPDGDALGQQVQVGHFDGNTNPIMTIVGVAGDVRQVRLGAETGPQLFVPRQQAGAIYGGFVTRSATLVVHAQSDPVTTMQNVRTAIRELDPNLPIANMRTMKAVVSGSISDQRFTSLTMGMFSAVALVLGAVGVYGLMAYMVAQRTREIGLRIALGADKHRVQRSVVKQGLVLALTGIGVGLIVSLGLTRFVDGLLLSINAIDPAVFLPVPILLILTSALAAYLPARKAASVDPMEAMRS